MSSSASTIQGNNQSASLFVPGSSTRWVEVDAATRHLLGPGATVQSGNSGQGEHGFYIANFRVYPSEAQMQMIRATAMDQRLQGQWSRFYSSRTSTGLQYQSDLDPAAYADGNTESSTQYGTGYSSPSTDNSSLSSHSRLGVSHDGSSSNGSASSYSRYQPGEPHYGSSSHGMSDSYSYNDYRPEVEDELEEEENNELRGTRTRRGGGAGTRPTTNPRPPRGRR